MSGRGAYGGRGYGGWGRGRGRGGRGGWSGGRGRGGGGAGRGDAFGADGACGFTRGGGGGGGGAGMGAGDGASASPTGATAAPGAPPQAAFSSPRPAGALESALRSIDGEQYPAYKRLAGVWSLGEGVTLRVDRVQGDAYAPPSRVRVLATAARAALPAHALATRARRIACADWLARRWAPAARLAGHGGGGGGGGGGWKAPKGGDLRADAPGQAVLERTSVQVHSDGSVEARCTLALPARGRTCLGAEAARALLGHLQDALGHTLDAARDRAEALERHCDVVEDAQALRAQLPARGLVAFVADGALLPRRSGADDRPRDGARGAGDGDGSGGDDGGERGGASLAGSRADARDVPLASGATVPFRSPPGSPLTVTLSTPHSGPLRGLGIPRGVTLIAGGGFHGKSTLLAALIAGVDDHVPGDGRERVVSLPSGVAVRAEDGRSVAAVDVSAWIGRLPGEGAGGEGEGADRGLPALGPDEPPAGGGSGDPGRGSPLSKKLKRTSLGSPRVVPTSASATASGGAGSAPADGRWGSPSRSSTAVEGAEGAAPNSPASAAPPARPLRSASLTTPNASGSTSQAAGVAEAIEVGCEVLFLDEDTSASNLLARDARMKALVPPAAEPIRVLLDSCRAMAPVASTVLVAGSSGDFLAVADAVIVMHDYLPRDETERAWAIARAGGRPGDAERDALRRAARAGRGGDAPLRLPLGREAIGGDDGGDGTSNSSAAPYAPPARRSLTSLLGVSPPARLAAACPRAPPRLPRVRTRGNSTVLLELPDAHREDERGEEELELGAVELLRDGSRTRAVAGALAALRARIAAGELSGPALDVATLMDWIDDGLDRHGLGFLEVGGDPAPGDWARPRRFEIAAALNRVRAAVFAQRQARSG